MGDSGSETVLRDGGNSWRDELIEIIIGEIHQFLGVEIDRSPGMEIQNMRSLAVSFRRRQMNLCSVAREFLPPFSSQSLFLRCKSLCHRVFINIPEICFLLMEIFSVGLFYEISFVAVCAVEQDAFTAVPHEVFRPISCGGQPIDGSVLDVKIIIFFYAGPVAGEGEIV